MQNYKQRLEVFILTYNRLEYLKESLASILNQTVKNIKITVIDNASDDGTFDYLKKMQESNHNLYVIVNEKNMGSAYSYALASKMATEEFAMVFHDDDILHPEYLKNVLDVINKYENVNIIATASSFAENINAKNWEKVSTKAFFCKDYEDLAAYVFYKGKIAYPSVVYKTAQLKKENFDITPFGKINDKPRVVELCKGGGAVVFKDKHYLRSRIHAGQDSSSYKTGPFDNEIINFNLYFKNILCKPNSPLKNKLIFNLCDKNHLYYCYVHMAKNSDKNWKNFIEKANSKGAVSFFTSKILSTHYGVWKIFFKLVKKISRFIIRWKMVG